MATRLRMRYREYHVDVDPSALPMLSAVCVTGEDADCGAASGEMHSREELARWIGRHCAETGHYRYERTRTELVVAEPGAWQ